MKPIISILIQSFVPGIEIVEYSIPSLNDDLYILDCVYKHSGLSVINFNVRITKSTGSIEFKIGSTRYYALGPEDKYKICDFITHLEILGQDLILKYSQIIKYLHAIPINNSLSEYVLVGSNDDTITTLRIKNDRIIFDYKEISKYTYASLPKLLSNPLISQFKKSNRWFW